MSNTIKALTSLFNKQLTLSEQEITLWVELYALTRQQQQFAQATLPLLAEHPAEQEKARQIITQDTLLRKTKGKLLSQVEKMHDQSLKQTLLDLLHQ